MAIKDKTKTEPKLSERESQRRLMARKRQAERDITIDYSRQNKRRRARYENNAEGFCRFYFPGTFYNPFCEHHREIIAAIVNCIRYGILDAIAAPRGEGKSSLVKVVAGVWAISYGHAKWFVPIESIFSEAEATLADIKSYYEQPEKGNPDYFGDDFPEICQPIRAMEGSSRRGESQTVDGHLTKIRWGTSYVRFPEVEGSKASGAMITPKSVEKAIRGLARRDRRPDIVVGNDLETDETARSVMVTEKIKENIQKGVMGLSGQSSTVGVLMVGTIINSRCLIAQWTDPTKNPAWNGKRYRFFNAWPTNKDLWTEYIYIRERNGIEASNKFYLKNRKMMDEGAVVSNPHRFNKMLGPNKKRLEYSAIQHGYNEIVKMKLPAFMSEYQNDPIQDENELMELQSNLITEKLNGLPKGKAPEGVEKITSFIDVHDTRLFWCVAGFKQGFVGYIMDYGVWRVNSPLAGSVTKEEKVKQVEVAIMDSLIALRNWMKKEYEINLVMIDSGYKSSVVYAACRKFGDNTCYPSRGMSTGGAGKYLSPKLGTKGVRFIGDGFHQSAIINEKIWLTLIDADKYKHFVQEGFRVADIEESGSLSLFGDDAHMHRAFAEHICDEQWNLEKNRFEGADGKQARNNHWLDCVAGCCTGAAMCGIKLIKPEYQAQKPQRKKFNNNVHVSSGGGLRTKY